MDGNSVGRVAVIMIFGIPMAAMYTFIHFSAYANCAARSPRSGILLVAGGIGYFVTFFLNGREEPEAMIAVTFGLIGLTVGIGFFVDQALIRRDTRTS